MSALLVEVLAQSPAPPPGQGEEFGKASPIALVVIVLLGLATVLLIRGMSKRIRRLPDSFGERPEREGEPPADGADGPADAPAPAPRAEDAGGRSP